VLSYAAAVVSVICCDGVPWLQTAAGVYKELQSHFLPPELYTHAGAVVFMPPELYTHAGAVVFMPLTEILHSVSWLI